MVVFICLFVHSLFIIGFLWPHTVILYVTSVLVGAGAALIWTGQGNYLTLMSTQKTISRNSGVFWAMLQSRYCTQNFHYLSMLISLDISSRVYNILDLDIYTVTL